MAYSKVQKFNHKTQQYECFFPLRVVGLAYELGHKLAEKEGVWAGFLEQTEGRCFHLVVELLSPATRQAYSVSYAVNKPSLAPLRLQLPFPLVAARS